MAHRCTPAELQHEGNVLDDEPARAVLTLHETEHFVHESGLRTRDAGRASGLREVLAREACGDQFRIAGERAETRDVRMERNVGEART